MGDLPQWSDIVAKAGNIPDDQLKAMQAGYFQSVLWPEMVRTGTNPMQMGAAMQEWMKMSDRTDRSSMPKTRVFATSAGAALARPVVSVASEVADKPEWRKGLNEWEQSAATEARRQGIDPTIPQFAGSMLGAVPYFTPVGKAVQGLGLAGAAADIATGAIGAGAYEAASAEPGDRVEAGLKGAAFGAAIPAAIHGAGKVLVRFKASGATGELPEAAAAQAVKQGAAEVVDTAPPAVEKPAGIPQDLREKLKPMQAKAAREAPAAQAQEQLPLTSEPPAGGQEVIQQPVAAAPQAAGLSEASIAGTPEPVPSVSPVSPAAPGESGAAPVIEKPTAKTVDTSQVQPLNGQGFEPGSVMRLPTESIIADPVRFQFKRESGSDLSAAQQYDQNQGGVLSVWLDPKDSQVYAVNGHNRLELAKRTGEPSLPVRFLDAASPGEARAKGALINIAEGRGTPVELHQVLQETGITPQELSNAIIETPAAQVGREVPEAIGRAQAPVPGNAQAGPPLAIGAGNQAGPQYPSPSVNPDSVKLATASKTAKPGTSPAAPQAFGGAAPHDGYTRVYLSGKSDQFKNLVGYTDPFAAQARAGAAMKYVDVPDQFLPHLQRANAPGELRVPSYLESDAKPVTPQAADGVIPLRDRPTGRLGSTGGYTIDPSITGVPSETAGKVAGVTWKTGDGQAATLQATLARDTTFHESIHRAIIQNGIDNAEQVLGSVNPEMSSALRTALPKASGVYDKTANEEIFTRLQTAIRVGDQPALKRFVDADTSEEHVLNYAVDQAKTVQAELARKPDGPARQMAERKLQDTIRRANRSLSDLEAQVEMAGGKIESRDGMLRYTEPGSETARVFDDRVALDKYLDDQPAFPEAPEYVNAGDALPGTPGLPPAGGPNSARFNTFGEPGISPENIDSPRRPVAAGVHGLSFYFRPFLGWLSNVAKKHDWPELYAAGEHFDLAAKDMSKWMHEWVDTKAGEALKGLSPKRYKDVWEYLTLKEQVASGKASQNALDGLAGNLKLTPQELASTGKVRDWLDAVGKELNIDPLTWIADYLPRLRKSNWDPDVLAQMAKSPDQIKFFAEMERMGELSNRETNLAAILYNYARLGAKKKFLNEPYQQMKAVIDGTTNVEDRLSRWTVLNKPAPDAGLLKVALERHLDYMAGRPDISQKLLESAVRNGIEGANAFLKRANGRLPAWMQMEPIEALPAEVIRKLMTLQTAGGLGFRAFVPLRDLFGGLMTGYPVIGEVHFAKGWKAAVTKAGWELADKYGAVAGKSDYMNLMTAGAEGAKPGLLTTIAEKSLEPTRWGHNVARVANFNGFYSKLMAELPALRANGNVERFVSRTGMNMLDPQMKAGLGVELAAAVHGGGNVDAAIGRIANRLTEATQFSFTKGAQAGLYKTGMGRVLGQYGTWPVGYVQWMRKISQLKGAEFWQATARIAASHTAVAAAGAAMGVDLSSMVFTTPMEWAGGPLLQVGLAVPHALGDFSKPEGAEARHKIGKALTTFIPGAVEAQAITKAVLDDDPDWYLRLLGIPTLTPAKKAQPMYKGLDTLEGN